MLPLNSSNHFEAVVLAKLKTLKNHLPGIMASRGFCEGQHNIMAAYGS